MPIAFTKTMRRRSMDTVKRTRKSNKSLSENESDTSPNTSTRMKQSFRKFPKSPLIVLKTPKIKISPRRSSLTKNKKIQKKTKSSPARSSTANEKKLNTTVNRKRSSVSTKRYSIKSPYILKEAVVVLQRLPDTITLPSSSKSLSPALKKLNFSNKSLQRPKRTVTKSNVETLSVPKSPKTSSAKKSSRDGTNKTTVEPLLSSTPNDKGSTSKTTKKSDAQEHHHLLNCTVELNEINMSANQTGTIVETTRKENVTYELSEPETPSLRKRVQEKRNDEKLAKKRVKVHFRKSVLNSSHRRSRDKEQQTNDLFGKMTQRSLQKNVSKSPMGGIEKRSDSVSSLRRSVSKSLIDGIHRSNSVTSRVDSSTPSPQTRRKSNSFSNLNSAITSSNSKSTLSNNKPDQKLVVKNKIPDFSKIHKKLFAKFESITDVKKRLEDRHAALTTPNKTSRKTITKKESGLSNISDKNPTFTTNRFGFKIRKQEATQSVLRSNSTQSIRSRLQEKNRMILKGVRTNRRFELQMKARNLKL